MSSVSWVRVAVRRALNAESCVSWVCACDVKSVKVLEARGIMGFAAEATNSGGSTELRYAVGSKDGPKKGWRAASDVYWDFGMTDFGMFDIMPLSLCM